MFEDISARMILGVLLIYRKFKCRENVHHIINMCIENA